MSGLVAIITAFAFFIVAAVAATVGIGGGVVYNPAMVLIGYDLKSFVLPVSLFLIFCTASSAAYGYYKQKMVDTKMGLTMGVSAIFGAPLGHYFSKIFSSNLILGFLSVSVALTGVRLLLKMKKQNAGAEVKKFEGNPYFIGVILGFTISVFATLVGIGGGVIMTPVLIFLGYPPKKAVATTCLAMIFTGLAGFISHLPTSDFNITFLVVFGGAYCYRRTTRLPCYKPSCKRDIHTSVAGGFAYSGCGKGVHLRFVNFFHATFRAFSLLSLAIISSSASGLFSK